MEIEELMSFKSFWGVKGEAKDDKGQTRPKMPTLREILEDIENIKKNDPILTLAAIINKNNTGRHSVVDSDIKELMEALQRRKRRESQSSSANHSSHTYSNFKNAKQIQLERGYEDKASKDDKQQDDNDDTNEEEGDIEERTRLTYDKLKHFLTTCEHSNELIGSLEGDLKRLQSEVAAHYIRQEQERQQLIIRDSAKESNLL